VHAPGRYDELVEQPALAWCPVQGIRKEGATSTSIVTTVRHDTTLAEHRRVQLARELERFVVIVTEQMLPDRIVLFGSMAAEHVGEWSDLDLVVVAETTLPFYQRLDHVFRSVQPEVGLDMLVYTPDEWAELSATRPFVQEEVIKKGRVIYERHG
jgi:predicted nucleotidyltransferase